jgi:hypothetical protein
MTAKFGAKALEILARKSHFFRYCYDRHQLSRHLHFATFATMAANLNAVNAAIPDEAEGDDLFTRIVLNVQRILV